MSRKKLQMELSGRIKAIRAKNGLSQKEMADRTGVALSTYQYYERGERIPPSDFLEKLITTFGVNSHWLLTGYEVMEIKGATCVPVNIYTLAGAGGPKDLTEYEPILSMSLPREFISVDIVPVLVRGASMYPTIWEGAVVGINTKDTQIVSGDMFALYMPYEGAVIKRLFVGYEVIIIKSDNPSFPTIEIPRKELDAPDNHYRLLGRVEWIVQRRKV